MSLNWRELWTVIHGMLLGALFLLAFAGGWVELLNLRAERQTPAGLLHTRRRLISGTWLMAIVAWLTVITGTWIIYPWYRAKMPAGAELLHYPRSYLLASPGRSAWHNFGMEWKEHVSWIAPMLLTAVAYIVGRYRVNLPAMPLMRRTLEALFAIAFLTAAIAGVFGAFINKVAPIR